MRGSRLAAARGALLGATVLAAAWAFLAAARVPAPIAWCRGFEATLREARERQVAAVVLFAREDRPLGAALRRELEASAGAREALRGAACGLADARAAREWLSEQLGVPAALAIVVLDPGGRLLAARVGYTGADELEELVARAAAPLSRSCATDRERLARAEDLGQRGLEQRAREQFDELLRAELPAELRAAALEGRMRLALRRGEVRAAAVDGELLAPLAAELPAGHWSFDRAWLAFARREVQLALELLSAEPRSDELSHRQLLRARILHELGCDADARVHLAAALAAATDPAQRRAARAARRHFDDRSLDHSHGPR